MGGKRPDQYRIAPDEAGATDYKTLPNEPKEVQRRDTKRFGRSRSKVREAQPVPPKVLDPAAERAREAELRREAKREQSAPDAGEQAPEPATEAEGA